MKLEVAAKSAGVDPRPATVAEKREIVASGPSIGSVSLAEFGEDHGLVPIRLDPKDQMMMKEALICPQDWRSSTLV